VLLGNKNCCKIRSSDAINTFTPDFAKNGNVYEQGKHYGVPGLLVDGLHPSDVAKGGKAVIDYIRKGNGPAILQVHTYRFNGHSPADPFMRWCRIPND
jgi:TPP-dependent pyruvate/acetoin dehydrogenase alpha subunit